MELWIRSQDKMKLKKTNGVYIILNSIYTNHEEIGKYETEKRALEVLDEIQKMLDGRWLEENTINWQVKDIFPIIVYQMPEE